MTDAIERVKCTIDDFTKASTVQALLTIVLTVVLAVLVIKGVEVPEYVKYAWFALLGVYMELPGKSKETR